MRKILFILFFAISIFAKSQITITNEHYKVWMPVMNAIEKIESGGNEKVVSSNGLWVGCMQISTCLVNAVNKIQGKKIYTYNDRYSRQKSQEMFIIFQETYNPKRNPEKAARLWNSGDLKCMQRKAKTERYYQKFKRHYSENES